uniref:Uncharacterized protein n=1 Tax=Candidatus Kentrum sp. LPFa TaxID=2126335 RepID=A0A450VY72_9GAMM|nr:MAG: hypothetical protein BECKLPF1236A_GA0070988_1002613 [Candidatus Kentron sp. LPFa]VFK33342.1 MAG: hypothetical protein BECKLPF1236C_GA0070990_102023 [Candidatus Kentron sp. LPFa]
MGFAACAHPTIVGFVDDQKFKDILMNAKSTIGLVELPQLGLIDTTDKNWLIEVFTYASYE